MHEALEQFVKATVVSAMLLIGFFAITGVVAILKYFF